MRTAASVERELLSPGPSTCLQTMALQDERNDLEDQEDIVELHAGCEDQLELQLDAMQEERDGAIAAYEELKQRVIDEVYEIIDNEGKRDRLLVVIEGTVE